MGPVLGGWVCSALLWCSPSFFGETLRSAHGLAFELQSGMFHASGNSSN